MRTDQANVVFRKEWTGLERFLGAEGLDGLRRPLWTIMASTHALQRSRGLAARERRLVDRIDTSVERLLTVVRDLVDGHAAKAGRPLPLFFRATDIRALASRVAGAARIDHPDRTIWCSVEAGGSAEWDPERVEQLLSSLLEHALVHDAPDATVSLVVRAVSEDWISFEIDVDGPRPEGSQSRPDTLPLVIARHVSRAHGGRMVTRRVGSDGVRFVVRLPRTPRES
jgi:signal transduction histidine kinase